MKLQKLSNKRAVSPVIAVVLLIALTVVSIAIIWNTVGNFTEEPVLITLSTTSATAATELDENGVWSGTIDVSASGTLKQVLFTSGNGTTFTLLPDLTLNKGANPLTLTIPSSGSNYIIADSYDLTLIFLANGNEGQDTASFDVIFT